MEKPLVKPPRIKILEAIGSIGDGRVSVISEEEAVVKSSGGEREYRVIVKKISENTFKVYSNDNGTVYRGYVGYPILAFLMVKGVLPIDNEVMNALKNIPWRELNEKYKKYSIVENIVLDRAERMGVKKHIVTDYMNIIMKKLDLLKFIYDDGLART